MTRWGDMNVHVTAMLPLNPSAGEVARRTVRHGFAAARLTGMGVGIMEWLGLEVGPVPEAKTHAIVTADPAQTRYAPTALHVSRELAARMVVSMDMATGKSRLLRSDTREPLNPVIPIVLPGPDEPG